MKKQKLNISGCLQQLILTIIIFISSIYILPYLVKVDPNGQSKMWGLSSWGLILSYWPYHLIAAILFIIHINGKTKIKTYLKVLPDGSTKIKSRAFIAICKILSIVVISMAMYGISISIGTFLGSIGKFTSNVFLSFAIGFSYNSLNQYIIISESSIEIKNAFGIETLNKNAIKNFKLSNETIFLITKYYEDENGNETKDVYNQTIIDCADLNISYSGVIDTLNKYGYLSSSKE